MELGPLDFSGILERTAALYAQNFIRLVALVAVTIVPVAIVQYFVLLRQQPDLAATLQILQHPQPLAGRHVPTLFNSPGTVAIVVAAALFGYYMLGFALAASAAAVQRRYAGEPITLRGCYEMVLPRWGSIVAVVGLAVLALVAAYMVTIAVVLIPIFIAAALGAFVAGVVTLAVTVLLIAMLFALLVIGITSACAACTVVVERCAATWSFRLTVARIFNRREFGRALLCAFTVGLTGLGASTLIDIAAFAGFGRWPAVYVAVDTLERFVVVPFLALLLCVYYFDVRMRHEGYDLTTTLARGPEEPIYAPTAYLSGEERAMIKRFLERRDSLSVQRRREIAAALAAPARRRVPPELQHFDDEPLLERLG